MVLATCTLACGRGPAPPPAAPPRAPAAETAPAPRAQTEVFVERAGAEERNLPASATFATLVRSARALDERGAPDATGRCLLGGAAAGPFRLEADLAAAVRPLPDAPASLAPRLGDGGPVRVLSRWGQRGHGSLSLVTFTGAPPPERGPATVLLLTEEGSFLRRTDGPTAPALAGPHGVDALRDALAAVLADAPARLYVSADGSLPLSALLRLLRALGDQPVVLAVALGEDVPLPVPLQPGRSALGLCPEGLPEPAPGRARGELPGDALRRPLGALRGAGVQCLASAAPESASGGRLRVTFRIQETGAVAEACALEDSLDDSGVRTCLLDAVRRLRFDTPDPVGFVDVAVPIVLTPDRSAAPRGACSR